MPRAARPPPIHVVLGVVARAGRVLVAQRDARRHQGGRLEFPGGKVERGESPEQALRRELKEEIGIAAEVGAPVIRFTYDYGDRRLLLDVREARTDQDPGAGAAAGRLAWRPVNTLSAHEFPPANRAILNALKLPHEYAITPAAPLAQIERRCEYLLAGGVAGCRSEVPQQKAEPAAENRSPLEGAPAERGPAGGKYGKRCGRAPEDNGSTPRFRLASGVRLIVLRAKDADAGGYRLLAARVAAKAREAGAELLLHDRPEQVGPCGAAGVHLSQAAFARLGEKRPVPPELWFAVSCHGRGELRRAEAAGADFCVLGPVKPTPGHAASLGFIAFEEIVRDARIPVYALGGMAREDLAEARARGAQGIAGIRCFDRRPRRVQI